ncbi:ubiquinone/menaquinone biosynthesis methyltransferase [Gemmata sp. SH-PL17]|uniref:class I SAM-dependent methyltransferase n=1 Tax=Gemmata sp. SH-PL17 TaxID=1630693 RepID=UPI00078C09C9|nr:class I SAM-dependent methyltransferase [Gemmata sp. SH-PL17]AMV24655.1 ubiquinone/menaquinone biosynthesis methyltransferase [Gemmata sp. SH-PL17]
MAIPDWQLPPGVDRGLWDYFHAADMVANYDDQMRTSPLASADVAFCEQSFPAPGKLVDLGCGTGRLCVHFAAKGYDCVGVDLSDEMLAKARENLPPHPPSLERKGEQKLGSEAPLPLGEGLGRGSASFVNANLVDLSALPEGSFDFAACLFSTLGMVRGQENRAKVLANVFRLLKPGGRFVLHVHNRFFRGLGLSRVGGQFFRTLFERPSAGDITMSQAYGGAPLTLHHFMKREAVMMLWEAGFRTLDGLPLAAEGTRAGWPRALRAYGWLLLSERPE